MFQWTGQGQDLLQQARQLHTESNDWRARRRFEKSADLLEQAFKLRRTALISPHPVLTATVDALSHLYQEMGEKELWRKYAKLGVEEKVQMLGELHVETQSALDNLHDACIALRDFEGAAEARERNWHSRTSTLGIKDQELASQGLVGDIERMLEYLRKMVPSIRRTTETDADLETRLQIAQGTVDTQTAVQAAQKATNALMHCDFNDQHPVKRDSELEQLLADRMTPADYLVQFGKPPEARWRRGSQIHVDAKTGAPATPPAVSEAGGSGDSRSVSASTNANANVAGGGTNQQPSSASAAAASTSNDNNDDEEVVAPTEDEGEDVIEEEEDGEAPPELEEEENDVEAPPEEDGGEAPPSE